MMNPQFPSSYRDSKEDENKLASSGPVKLLRLVLKEKLHLGSKEATIPLWIEGSSKQKGNPGSEE
jgi:hypothetical protein